MPRSRQPEPFFGAARYVVFPLKFSGKLQLYRQMKGWTIRQLAEKVGLKADHLEYVLTGKHEPGAGDIVKIERRLGIQFEPEDFE